ncbi:hypothetical protein GCM10010915_11880 [Microbacterium faecale]|uniref:Rho termination factor N-terminal domain-containing protein n=1 Tax=Microbacterium faecale TaxID=1804630 RepID=A0A917DF63_9MICO|nr:hypothetical protein [Microbacterium faecale]GGD33119.1 hypothetical protein GCM10010915_11880 [Microbacterium faecale]
MPKITTPVKGFTGKVAGVSFVDGKGETTDKAALAYFRRHGYGVDAAEKAVEIPEGEPTADWTAAQLKAYAEKHEVDLGQAKTKPEIVEAIEKAATPPADDDK